MRYIDPDGRFEVDSKNKLLKVDLANSCDLSAASSAFVDLWASGWSVTAYDHNGHYVDFNKYSEMLDYLNQIYPNADIDIDPAVYKSDDGKSRAFYFNLKTDTKSNAYVSFDTGVAKYSGTKELLSTDNNFKIGVSWDLSGVSLDGFLGQEGANMGAGIGFQAYKAKGSINLLIPEFKIFNRRIPPMKYSYGGEINLAGVGASAGIGTNGFGLSVTPGAGGGFFINWEEQK